MKKLATIIMGMLLLSACETNSQDAEAIKAQVKTDAHTVKNNVEHNTLRVASTARNSVKSTGMMLRKWLLTPLANTEPTPVPPSYCYKVMQDINCYRSPLPGQTHRLVGFQGDMNPAPPLAQTKALPLSPIQKMNAASAAMRVANAKPVFVSIPTQPKEDNNSKIQDGVVQVGSEPLPDPMLSPQL